MGKIEVLQNKIKEQEALCRSFIREAKKHDEESKRATQLSIYMYQRSQAIYKEMQALKDELSRIE